LTMESTCSFPLFVYPPRSGGAQLKRITVRLTRMTWWRRNRPSQDVHFLNEHGMVACNPRDREAAHRAENESIATEDPQAVTCRKCWMVIRATDALRSRSGNTTGESA
jgi:hypothetical protein